MINRDLLFIWDKNKIRYYELDQDFDEKNMKYVRLEIDSNNKVS